MEKRVAIIGAGISGLLACKYTLEKGFNPIVFESEQSIGGVWCRTLQSTKLQNPKEGFHFSDFPWPPSVEDVYPTQTQMMEYFESYGHHFGLLRCIRFNSKVVSIDYVGESCDEMEAWDLWGGAGKAFGSKGKWHITVQDTKNYSTDPEVLQVEFVILCVGRFSGVPNIPEFPPNRGPDVFSGQVIHSMDYSAMDNLSAKELIRRKRVTIVGSQKSAIDIAAECADANGPDYPCVVIQRNAHWLIPFGNFWRVVLAYLYFNRFSELLLHKPGESLALGLLATLLSPLRWGISKFAESYLRWKLPLKKYGTLPKHSFLQDICSCEIALLPENFYSQVEKGGIKVKKSQSFSFCKQGLMIDGESQPIVSDVVILATGYKGDQKLSNMFKSPEFKKAILGSPTSTVPLYRQMIHPQIPQLAIIGYSESLSNLFTSEIRCQWLANFLDEKFELPAIKEMKKEVMAWESYMKRYAASYFRRSSIGGVHIWYNDQLCKDLGREHRRKKGFFAELFQPYGPADYAGLANN